MNDIVVENVKNHLGLDSVTEETAIYGDSSLESLELVSLLLDIESDVYEKLGKEIVIASERAMSLKRSPFATVGALSSFVEELLKE